MTWVNPSSDVMVRFACIFDAARAEARYPWDLVPRFSPAQSVAPLSVVGRRKDG